MTWQYNAKITMLTWRRWIPVEEWQAVQHEGWWYPPDNAYNTRSERRQHRYEQYACGTDRTSYRDSSGKTQTRSTTKYCSRPKYDTYYFYTLDEWTRVKEFSASGDYRTSPLWPDATDYTACEVITFGCQRLSTRSSHYQLTAARLDKPKEYKLDVTQEVYDQLEIGQRITVEVNLFGTVLGLTR